MDELSGLDIASYGGIGALLPLLIAFINRPSFPTWLRGLIMIGVAAVVGIITYGLRNDWSFASVDDVLTAVIGVVGATQVAYLALWKQNGITNVIQNKINSGPADQDADAASDDQEVDEEVPDDLVDITDEETYVDADVEQTR